MCRERWEGVRWEGVCRERWESVQRGGRVCGDGE